MRWRNIFRRARAVYYKERKRKGALASHDELTTTNSKQPEDDIQSFSSAPPSHVSPEIIEITPSNNISPETDEDPTNREQLVLQDKEDAASPPPERVPLRRSLSYDSFSTFTTADGSRLESGNIGVCIVWDDDVIPPAEIRILDDSPISRIQKARKIPDPSFDKDDYDNDGELYDNDREKSAVDKLLAQRIFSTLGMTTQHNQQWLQQHPSKRSSQVDSVSSKGRLLRRPTLRPTYSGGLDSHLAPPERFTRFEI